jgi:hypothetical protein
MPLASGWREEAASVLTTCTDVFLNITCWIWHNGPCSAPTQFRDMKTAPLEGTLIEVRYSQPPEIAVARWPNQMQGWLQDVDPHRIVLHQVTGWRPLKR